MQRKPPAQNEIKDAEDIYQLNVLAKGRDCGAIRALARLSREDKGHLDRDAREFIGSEFFAIVLRQVGVEEEFRGFLEKLLAKVG